MPLLQRTEGREEELLPEGGNSGGRVDHLRVTSFLRYERGADGKPVKVFNWTVPKNEEGRKALEERLKYYHKEIEQKVGYKINKIDPRAVTKIFVEKGYEVPKSSRWGSIWVISLKVIGDLTRQGDLFAATLYGYFETHKELYYMGKHIEELKLRHYHMWKTLKERFSAIDDVNAVACMTAIENESLGEAEMPEMCCRLGTDGGGACQTITAR